jgi:hypothetical protein
VRRHLHQTRRPSDAREFVRKHPVRDPPRG